MADETTEVVMTEEQRMTFGGATSEAQLVIVKREDTESHPLPVPSTSNQPSSSHFIKREYSDGISSVQCRKRGKKNADCNCDECEGEGFVVGEDEDDGGELVLTDEEDEKDKLRLWVRVTDPGTPAYLPPEWEDDESQANHYVHSTQSEPNPSTISTDHQTAQTDSAQFADPLPVNKPELQLTSRQTTAVNYQNTDVDTDSSDDEFGNSDDQPETAHLNNSAVATPARQTQNRILSPETTNTTDSHKRTKPASYRCTVPDCGRVYQSRVGLYQHQAVHSGKFNCEQCDKSCQSNFVLKQHQLTHTTEKPYQCTECHRAFAQKSTLTIHHRIHSGEKPFHCTFCDKTFTQSGSLTTHLRMHTHDRPYKCTHCSYASAQKNNLTRHLRLHFDQLPYQCEQCMKQFNQKHQLTRHMRNKHC